MHQTIYLAGDRVQTETEHDLKEIERRTIHLMETLGRRLLERPLPALGWTFQFDRAHRRLGSCRWRRQGPTTLKVITLSRPIARLNGWAVMEDVARHEIAHAIDFEIRGRSDHGPEWKRWARRCGADPTRLYEDNTVEAADSRYVGICPACGKEHPYHRMLSRAHACSDCCKQHNGGRYAEQFKLRLIERSTGQPAPPPPKRNRKAVRPKYVGTCPSCGHQIGFARKLRRSYACRHCCEQHNAGKYDQRFEYEVRPAG